MPVAIIDIPCLAWSAKEHLHKDVAESMHHAYQMPDNRVYLREWTAEQTSFDGVVGASFRPLCNLIVPPILTAESRKMLASRVSSAIARACDLRPRCRAAPKRRASQHAMSAVVLPRASARASRARRPDGVREPNGTQGQALRWRVHTVDGAAAST